LTKGCLRRPGNDASCWESEAAELAFDALNELVEHLAIVRNHFTGLPFDSLNKKAAVFGSYGWSKGGIAAFQKLVEPLKWEVTDILEFRGGPTRDLLKKGEEFGERFAAAVKTP